MLEQIKANLNLIVSIIVLAVVSVGVYKFYSWSYDRGVENQRIETNKIIEEYRIYKTEVERLRVESLNKKELEVQKQKELYELYKAKYLDSSNNLDIALKRLRDLRTLPWEECVQMADSSGVSGINKGGDTTKVDKGSPASGGIPKNTETTTEVVKPYGWTARDYFEASMHDTQQCYDLIQLLKVNPLVIIQ
jgi:hypothetical protein